jgi:hypothetical protein
MDDTTDAAARRRAPRRGRRGFLLTAALATLPALTTDRGVLILWPAGTLWVGLSLVAVRIALAIPAGLVLGRMRPPDPRPAHFVLAALLYCTLTYTLTPGGHLLARSGPVILAALPLLALGVAQAMREKASRLLQREQEAWERKEVEEDAKSGAT